MNELLEKLNDEQKDAAKTIEGPVLVLAGAGSGKTRVVTCRIVHMIEMGIPPSSILGLTFTNRASAEMRERVAGLTKHQVLVCTFHSLGARVLRESISALGYQRDFNIYDDEDVDKLLKACLSEFSFNEKKVEVKPFKQLISRAKNGLKLPHEVDTTELETDVERAFPAVYDLYQRKLKEYNAVDFDDLLFLVVRLWREHPQILERYQTRWPFVLIDEYQDTNAAQYTMIQLLVEKSNNIFAVGDPDQSIYSWRGANINNILNFEKDYRGTKLVRLEQNYRSRSNILDAANSLIRHNDNRYEKNLWSDLGPGEKPKLFVGEDERVEAQFVARQIRYHHEENQIALKEMVVFYRTNAQSRIFEDYLANHSLPYVIVGGISFYQRREVKDVLAFLRVVQSGADFVSFARTINLPKRGFGETSIEKIRLGATEAGMTVLAYCESLITNPSAHSFRLSSKQKESMVDYLKIIHELREISKKDSIKDLVIGAIEETRYLSFLKEDPESYADRKENLDELITKAVEWELFIPSPTLEQFLEELSLKSSLDAVDPEQDRLNLMTIHNGKGLEFQVTFVVGLEEDLFPHVNSKQSREQIEEERRLCYVGMTRAKEYLYLSYCHTRYLWGNLRMQRPSRFLKEISTEFIEKFRSMQSIPTKKLNEFKPVQKEKVVQHDYSSSGEEFDAEDTIFHKDFGIGQIREVYQGSMGLTYKIFFTKDNTVKTLVAKYAHLTRL
ncbi:MAG: UvrD-helicase domain-containing protein [Parachlamydiaceae bacterium]|nr:UvrD-helicase domain-containing protein [Parachlamydiaceae bacterium]